MPKKKEWNVESKLSFPCPGYKRNDGLPDNFKLFEELSEEMQEKYFFKVVDTILRLSNLPE